MPRRPRDPIDDSFQASPEAHSAFGEFYLDWHRVVWWEARKHMPCDTDADGVVQRVFMRLWQEGPDAWCPDTPNAFFRTAARNEALSTLHSAHRRPISIDDRVESNTLVDRDPLPDEEAARHELEGMVRDAVAELPSGCRRVMQFVLDGYTQSEIAAQLHITVKAVGKQTARGRRLLKPRLASYDGGRAK